MDSTDIEQHAAMPHGVSSNPWAVAAPFIDTPDSPWISDFVTSPDHVFTKIAHRGENVDWHQKKTGRTGLSEWRAFDATARSLLGAARSTNGGAITVFPQLAAAAATRKRVQRLDVPLVSWFFNTTFGRDLKSLLALPALRAVDRFVVHSTNEIEAYADHLGLPSKRFSFAHVQYGGAIQPDSVVEDDPFVFATGSGFRDYGTLFDAVERIGVKTKVVAGPRILAGLTPPPNVEILDGVDRTGIHRLVRQATVNVLPMTNVGLTAGLITIAEAFRHGRGLVVSDRQGIDDYVEHEANSLLVPVGDGLAMADAIESVFVDPSRRDRLNEAARLTGDRNHTDLAGGRRLVEVLGEVVGERSA